MADQRLARRVLRYRWVIFWVMAVGYVFVYFHRLSPAVVALDIQQSFQASGGLMGVLASAYFYPYALMQFPAGLLSDSLGPRKIITFFLLIAGAGSILFGLAPGMEVAVVARVLVGLGVSMVFIPAMKLFSQWFRIREFALVTAILVTMGGMGALTAAAPLALITGWMGWRAAFEMIGAGTFIIAVLVWLLVRNRPEDMNLPSLAQIDRTSIEITVPILQIPLWEGARRVVTDKRFWPIALWSLLEFGVFFSFGGLWAGPYLMHVYGMTRAEAGSVLNMIALGMIVGSPFMSVLSDRVFHSRKKVLILMSAVLVGELLFLNLFPDGLSRSALYLVFFLLTVCSSAIVVIAVTTTKELFPIEIAGTSVGTLNLFPFLGGAIMQVVLGRVLDAYPKTPSGAYAIEAYSTLLLILLIIGAAALACTFMMKETFPASVTK